MDPSNRWEAHPSRGETWTLFSPSAERNGTPREEPVIHKIAGGNFGQYREGELNRKRARSEESLLRT
jgi:hypothetical protein